MQNSPTYVFNDEKMLGKMNELLAVTIVNDSNKIEENFEVERHLLHSRDTLVLLLFERLHPRELLLAHAEHLLQLALAMDDKIFEETVEDIDTRRVRMKVVHAEHVAINKS